MTDPIDEKAARAAARVAKQDAMIAARAAFESLPEEERRAHEERLAALLEAAAWRFAKTMPHNPHWYTLRKTWSLDEDFVWAVEQIRLRGYRHKYESKWYTQLDVHDHFYWTMGWPINYGNGAPCTILINRKPLVFAATDADHRRDAVTATRGPAPPAVPLLFPSRSEMVRSSMRMGDR
jgi:hypothetical protein